MTGSGSCSGRLVGGDRIGAAQLLAGAVDGEHPVDAGWFSIATTLPIVDLGHERSLVGDSAVQALADHHADLHLYPVRATGMPGCVVELETVEDAACFRRREPLIE